MRLPTSQTMIRLRPDAGVGSEKMLLIIAVMGIIAAVLVYAVVSGDGKISSPTGGEGDKTKAAALMQIGENLKVGMDRLMLGNGITYNTWVIDPASTSNSTDLFSPNGGGVSAPPVTMAGAPKTDTWYYPQIAIPNLGTYSVNSVNVLQTAMLNVAPGVCQEINNRANGQNIVPTAVELGNFAMPASGGSIASATLAAWPATTSATNVNLYGKPVGCVHNSDKGSSGYYFYQVLYVQ